MKLAEAFSVVKQLCDAARLTAQERDMANQALSTILEEVKKPNNPTRKEEKDGSNTADA